MKITMIKDLEEFIQRIPHHEAFEKKFADLSLFFESHRSQENSSTSSQPTGWFESYYIGPTGEEVMKEMPTPLHAADYIAQQHDLEYQALGLNGVSGTLDSRSNEADRRLIVRCNELISMYDRGERSYHGYPITPTAYHAAYYMKEYFLLEESITDFICNKF